MRPSRRTHAQRRSDAAPLALVLAGWELAVAPVAHPLLAHGVPFLRDAADARWVQHFGDGSHDRPGPRESPPHSHAPGAPEHLQLPVLAAAGPTVLRTVVLALPAPRPPEGRPVFPRRWSREQPQAP